MYSFLQVIGLKNIFLITLVIAIVGNFMYQKKVEESLEKEITESNIKLNEANENNRLMNEAYELTLKVEKETSVQKAITQEQKEVVVTKYKTLIKEVEKRGEIKQDEKSSFTIVTF